MEGIPEGLKWVVGTIVAIFVALGGILGTSKIRELLAHSRIRQQAELDTSMGTTRGKLVEADVTLTQSLLQRITTLEANVTNMQAQLVELTGTNASLVVTNKYLEKEIEKRDTLIEKLSHESEQRQGRIKSLEDEVIKLKESVMVLTAEKDDRLRG
jgi:predicted nuclease with TOPRIM domain